MKIHPVRMVPLASITKDENNAYEHNDAEIQRLFGVIQEFGFAGTLALTPELALIGGEARLEVLTMLDFEEAPCHIVEGLSDDERKTMAIALNGKYGHWDDDKLRTQLLDLKRNRTDLDLTGLSPFHIESTLDLSKKKRDFSRPGQQNQAVPPLSYQIVFDDDTQLDLFHDFVRYLTSTYPHHDSLGARLSVFVAELQLEASNEDIA